MLECWDREEGQDVAIKVVRNLQRYRDAAKTEIDVLQTLQEHDKEGLRSGRVNICWERPLWCQSLFQLAIYCL